ncbi:Chemotaxis protein methyltransferase Cher2 [Methyloligella halotolerans]|uniref:protein-glutamate O-methyltransferase n=1 Tax=Methyloligella halotolerans TaxID=1177755 RepID=A0A1E2S049_9HYPH|nr:protein-glutamate O-methyltransferase CheR [Methyloligella halotolerans]ODA67718.1 Chemotaxis protein methyltransferase Cher2 [Methyloligella halotolerans]
MLTPMTPQEFKFLAHAVKSCTGMTLKEDQEELLHSRLKRVLKEYQLDSVSALCGAIARSDGESLKWRLAECVAVQETYFFRDKSVFECFEERVLPSLLEARQTSRRLRIWCAGCSTGQEPYAIAMALAEKGDLLQGWEIEILATDFSEEALLFAQKGVYSQFQVQRGLPVTLLLKYFKRVADGWEIVPEIRERVRFRHQNLMHNSMRHGVFDVIFCRNVLIYFDEPTKRQVLSRLSQQIQPDGYLLLGATESVLGLSDRFAPLAAPCPGVFQPISAENRDRTMLPATGAGTGSQGSSSHGDGRDSPAMAAAGR